MASNIVLAKDYAVKYNFLSEHYKVPKKWQLIETGYARNNQLPKRISVPVPGGEVGLCPYKIWEAGVYIVDETKRTDKREELGTIGDESLNWGLSIYVQDTVEGACHWTPSSADHRWDVAGVWVPNGSFKWDLNTNPRTEALFTHSGEFVNLHIDIQRDCAKVLLEPHRDYTKPLKKCFQVRRLRVKIPVSIVLVHNQWEDTVSDFVLHVLILEGETTTFRFTIVPGGEPYWTKGLGRIVSKVAGRPKDNFGYEGFTQPGELYETCIIRAWDALASESRQRYLPPAVIEVNETQWGEHRAKVLAKEREAFGERELAGAVARLSVNPREEEDGNTKAEASRRSVVPRGSGAGVQ